MLYSCVLLKIYPNTKSSDLTIMLTLTDKIGTSVILLLSVHNLLVHNLVALLDIAYVYRV